MLYQMKCRACGNTYEYQSAGVLIIPTNQQCPECGKWTGEPMSQEDELPTIDEFVGSDPNYTGDMTTEEYIRQIRRGNNKEDKMKCSYCENEDGTKCSACDSFACQEHMYFNREGNKLVPLCIHCYEEIRQAQGDNWQHARDAYGGEAKYE